MSVRSAQSVTVLFTTRVLSTGVGTNADSLPAGTLFVNGTANGASVAVTNVSTGLYKAAVTLPTLAVGDEVEIVIAATVSGVSDSAVIWGDTKDFFAGSVPDVAAGGNGGLPTVNASNQVAGVSGNVVGSVASVVAAVSVTGDLSATMKTSVQTAADAAITANGTVIATAASAASADSKAIQLLGYSQRATIRGTVGLESTLSTIVTSALDIACASAAQFQSRVLIFDNTTTTAALQGKGAVINSSTVSATPAISLNSVVTALAVAGDTFTIY